MSSKEVRRLKTKWDQGPWPQLLEWIELHGLRGWTGERISFNFPIVAIVGENGAGKSTVIQAAASLYRAPMGASGFFASDFFPDTAWEKVTGVVIQGSVRQGENTTITRVRKPTTRWRGNPDRKERYVEYLDLRRTQPIYAKTGYGRLAKSTVSEHTSSDYDASRLTRLSYVIGKEFGRARQSITDVDHTRSIPVLSVNGQDYSGFHQGAGESTVMDLLALPLPKYGLILIDEVETSLHPRAQRRLIRDLAERARQDQLQIIVTTHSPYILEELPAEARIQVSSNATGKAVAPGVSPEFALTKMDEEGHPEADVYVEDDRARILVEEVLAAKDTNILSRVKVTPFGAASVGKALGQMVSESRFSRPTIVYLDADQDPAAGCHLLPGDDAPERVVFGALERVDWKDVALRVNRSHAELVDHCQKAVTNPDHHEWVKSVADGIVVGGHDLWRAMCISYVQHSLDEETATALATQIRDAVEST